jgi:uncharacterized protein YwgA
MMADVEAINRILRLNGGSLVGKTRLQKTAYFLEATGVGFGFDFEYHHYGPYSEELASLADDAKALDLINVKWTRSIEGAEYATFIDNSGPLSDESLDANRRAVLHVLDDYTSTELELAATTHFLSRTGYGSRAWDETKRRKASKITPQRIDRANQLLRRLEQLNSLAAV